MAPSVFSKRIYNLKMLSCDIAIAMYTVNSIYFIIRYIKRWVCNYTFTVNRSNVYTNKSTLDSSRD